MAGQSANAEFYERMFSSFGPGGGDWGDIGGTLSDQTDLQAALDAKAPTSHSHVIGDTTGLQTALDAKAPLASPALTGNPTAPTQTLGNSSTRLATTEFVAAAVAALIASAPGALDTLDELAAALGDDANFASTITTALGTKLVKSSNLSDLTDVAAARTNLGLAALAVLATVGTSQIDNSAVTLAKIQNIAAARLLGSVAGGAPAEMRVGQGIVFDADGIIIDATLITGKTLATPVSGDHFLFRDATDGGLKKCDFDDLGGGGGGLSQAQVLARSFLQC